MSRQIVCQQVWNEPECFVKAAEYIEQSGPWIVRQWLPLKIESNEYFANAADFVCEICYGLCDLEELRLYQPELQRQISEYCNQRHQIGQDWVLRKSLQFQIPIIKQA